MSFTHKRLAACTAAGALVVSGLLLTATPAQAANKVIKSNEVDTSETRATGHNVFLNDGVRVYTEGSTNTDKAAGYFETDIALADAGEPGMQWSANAGQAGSNVRPSVQLVMDFDADGQPDGILVGEPTYADGTPLYGNDWWISNGSKPEFKEGAPEHGGGSGSSEGNHGTLDGWRAAYPDANILQTGWSLGSGVKGDGTINSISVGSNNYFFTDGVQTTLLYRNDVTERDTRSAGHNVFRPTGGIRVYTDDSSSEAKADGYFATPGSLAAAGEPVMDLRTLSGSTPPGLQLLVDFDNDGTEDGTLVGEPKFYGNDWWITNGSKQEFKDAAPEHSGGSGSSQGNHGTLAGWREAFPDAQILESGYSLGSGVLGNFIIDGITVGLTKYTFTGENRAPVVDSVTGSTSSGVPLGLTLEASDPDDEAVTFALAADQDAAASLTEEGELAFATPRTAVGTRVIEFTVTDARGASTQGTATITIARATSATAVTLNPTKPTKSSTIKVDTVVTSTGYVKGGTVDVMVDGKKLRTGVITSSSGKLRLTLPKKLAKGTHKIGVFFRGTATAKASSKGVTVKITK